jgi:hypothetical protein
MDLKSIFVVQLAATLALYATLVRRWVWPWLRARPLEQALAPLALLHALRTVGVPFALPEVLDAPAWVGRQIGYGDLVTSLLALGALITLRPGSRLAMVFVWLFNVVGFADILNGMQLGARYELVAHTIPAYWWIQVYLVPALLISHLVIFALLLSSMDWRRRSVRGRSAA